MDYQSILKRIEEQKRDENLSVKLFRYTGLIQAIEFFSQRLNMDQIIDSAFDFVNELLTIEKSAVFIKQGGNYVLKRLKGYESAMLSIKYSGELERLASLHGALLYDREQLEKFFDKTVLDAYNVTTVIPLISSSTLYGFILLSKKMTGELNSDDYIISEALMRLINNAIENYKKYEELQSANKELDEKIFNLFAINQSSKVLLSELSLEVLYNLSVDVFSELTQSSSTGFVLFDEKSEKFLLRGYKDIFYKQVSTDISLTLNKMAIIDINRVIISTSEEKDIQYFNTIFMEGVHSLELLKAQYIVLLIKNGRVLGFVTLGQTVTASEYKKSIFELVESLASATYIAINNAQLFKQVNEQKKAIQTKLEKLISLNSLMKNINSSVNLQILTELTLKTLDVSFDVDKALIALYNKEEEVLEITNTLGIETDETKIMPNPNWEKVFEGDTVYMGEARRVLGFIGSALAEDIGELSGLLIVPIYIDRLEVELLGVVIIFKYRKTLINDEESRLTVETIAGHIAPVISNLHTLEEQKRFSLPNYIEMFKKDLKQEIDEALQLDYDLQVVQITDNRDRIFKEHTLAGKLKESYTQVYPFSYNTVFVIISEKEDDLENKLKSVTGLDNISVRVLTLGVDFKSYQEFFELF